MFAKYKKIIIVLVLIIIGILVYTLTRPDPTPDLNTSISGQSETEILSQEIIRAINQIQTLKLDKSIFDDPILKSLKDKSRPIDPIESGRNNPFAPLPGINDNPVVEVQSNTTNR